MEWGWGGGEHIEKNGSLIFANKGRREEKITCPYHFNFFILTCYCLDFTGMIGGSKIYTRILY